MIALPREGQNLEITRFFVKYYALITNEGFAYDLILLLLILEWTRVTLTNLLFSGAYKVDMMLSRRQFVILTNTVVLARELQAILERKAWKIGM